jgi:hypothetical protein
MHDADDAVEEDDNNDVDDAMNDVEDAVEDDDALASCTAERSVDRGNDRRSQLADDPSDNGPRDRRSCIKKSACARPA